MQCPFCLRRSCEPPPARSSLRKPVRFRGSLNERLSLLAAAGALADPALPTEGEARGASCSPLHPPGMRYNSLATIPTAFEIAPRPANVGGGWRSLTAESIGMYQDLQQWRTQQNGVSRQPECSPRPSSSASFSQPEQAGRWETHHNEPAEFRVLEDKHGGRSDSPAAPKGRSAVGATDASHRDAVQADRHRNVITPGKSESSKENVDRGGNCSNPRSESDRSRSDQSRLVARSGASAKDVDGSARGLGEAGMTGAAGQQRRLREDGEGAQDLLHRRHRVDMDGDKNEIGRTAGASESVRNGAPEKVSNINSPMHCFRIRTDNANLAQRGYSAKKSPSDCVPVSTSPVSLLTEPCASSSKSPWLARDTA